MRKYPLLISFALLFWGYNTGNLSIAVIFMILLESHRIIKFRWDFSTENFNMISIVSTLSAIGYLLYFTNSEQSIGFISAFITFLPIILFPLIFFFLYSTSEHINAKNLFLLFIVNKYSIVHPYTKKFRPDYLYFASLLVGGSVTEGIYSFPIVLLLIFPVLFFNRSKNYKLVSWILSLISVISLTLILQFSISNTFFFMKKEIISLYLDHFLQDTNKMASIGNIGSMKDDFKIELRAKIYDDHKFYYHLKSEVFNYYNNNVWKAITNESISVPNNYFKYGVTPVDSIRIFFFSSRKNSYLKLPFTANSIFGITQDKLRNNSLGRITVSDPQYLTDYKAYSRLDTVLNYFSDPQEVDLQINPKDAELILPIIDSLKLDKLPFSKIHQKLSNYFISEYRYSLDYIDQSNVDKLKNFVNQKEGHCELFATISCLIYRKLGYPSRYVTGYLVSEYNEFEELYVARKKDRHAWIYVNDKEGDKTGNWHEFDTTPPDISMNRSDSGIFGNLYDFVSYTYYKAFMFRKYNNKIFKNILLLSIIPLALFLLFRILKGVKYKKNTKKNQSISHYSTIEELSLLKKKLNNNQIKDYETLLKWFERIRLERRNAFLTGVEKEQFDIIQKLYYQKRYFPNKFSKEDDEKLKKLINNIS